MNRLKYMICLSFVATASISANMLAPALPDIQITYHLASRSVNWVMSIFLIGYVIGQLVYGPMANRFGRISTLRFGFVINLLGIGLSIISFHYLSFRLLLMGRLITALGASAGLACTFMLLKELLTEHQAKRSMTHMNIAFGSGIGVSTMLSGMVAHFGHWQYCLWILLAHGVLLFAATYLFPETLPHVVPLQPRKIFLGYQSALNSRRLLKASLCVGFATALNYCFATAAPIFALHTLHLNLAQYGLLNWLNVFAMLLISIVGANWINKFGAQTCLTSSLILLMPILLVLLFMLVSQWISIVGFYLATIAMFSVSRITYASAAYIATRAIDDIANAAGMMSFINLLTATLSVSVMGYLPLSSMPSFAVVGLCLCALCVISQAKNIIPLLRKRVLSKPNMI